MSEEIMSHSEINSLEFYQILIHDKEPDEKFADYDRISHHPMIVKMKKSGKVYLICDDPPKTNRQRSIEELLIL